MRILKLLFVVFALVLSFASCTSINKSMREPNTRLNLTKSDFTLSDQVSAEATSTKILGIDWKRLFKKETGTVEGGAATISLASIPVIGNYLGDKTANYSLYELMSKNPGYDVVFYPSYETKSKSFLIFYKKTTVKTTARLGKLNK